MARGNGTLLQGTLGLLILKALAAGELHGYGIARWIEEVSGDVLQVEEGSLYPALRRLEDRGFVTSRWKLTDTNRRARYYALTPAGKADLRRDAAAWLSFSAAVTLILRERPSIA
ncbi:MAG TPA: PadR family transcriptional regulator [Longimicrobiales bacterium]